MEKQLLIEQPIPLKFEIVEGGSSGGPLKARGIFQRSDQKNENGRIYSRKLWERILKEEKTRESIEAKRMVGEIDHPAESELKLSRASHIITDLKLESDGTVHGEFEVLEDSPYGRQLSSLIRQGVEVGISSRGLGTTERRNGSDYVKENDFDLITFDIVASPSTPGAFPEPISESKENNMDEDSIVLEEIGDQVDYDDLREEAEAFLNQNPFMTTVTERAMFVDRADDLVRELDEVADTPGIRATSQRLIERVLDRQEFLQSAEAPPAIEEQLKAAFLVIDELVEQINMIRFSELNESDEQSNLLYEAAEVIEDQDDKIHELNRRVLASEVVGDALLEELESLVVEQSLDSEELSESVEFGYDDEDFEMNESRQELAREITESVGDDREITLLEDSGDYGEVPEYVREQTEILRSMNRTFSGRL